MRESERIILHVDMDHFYTAVEERENLDLQGKPVVVGADPKNGKGRGVVSTSNYEARKAGIRSGMPISRAWKLCPEAIFLPPNFPLYIKVSNAIMEIIRIYADKFEQWGIDEAFLDVSSRVKDYEEAQALAEAARDAAKVLRDEEEAQNALNGKLKILYETQDKIFQIEEKLYKLRHGEDEQLEDMFETLAEQGLVNQEIIDAYAEMERAEGGVLKLNHEYMEVMGLF